MYMLINHKPLIIKGFNLRLTLMEDFQSNQMRELTECIDIPKTISPSIQNLYRQSECCGEHHVRATDQSLLTTAAIRP